MSAGCGTVEPQSDEHIVVEGFVVTDSDLPRLTIRKTAPLRSDLAPDRPEEEAAVWLHINGDELPYEHISGGQYRPLISRQVHQNDVLELVIDRDETQARSQTTAPPPIHIDSVAIRPAEEPIEAVLIDSLSLQPGTGDTGFLYLVDVAVEWLEGEVDDSSYVRLQLRPESDFESLVIDLFLRSDEVSMEDQIERPVPGRRQWNGVYAVRVDGPDAPFPEHRLRISLIRSGSDYARFALSADAADRREPVGNIEGGLGIFTAISIDSMHVTVGG